MKVSEISSKYHGNIHDSRKAKKEREKNISQTLRLKLKNSDEIPFVPLIISHMT